MKQFQLYFAVILSCVLTSCSSSTSEEDSRVRNDSPVPYDNADPSSIDYNIRKGFEYQVIAAPSADGYDVVYSKEASEANTKITVDNLGEGVFNVKAEPIPNYDGQDAIVTSVVFSGNKAKPSELVLVGWKHSDLITSGDIADGSLLFSPEKYQYDISEGATFDIRVIPNGVFVRTELSSDGTIIPDLSISVTPKEDNIYSVSIAPFDEYEGREDIIIKLLFEDPTGEYSPGHMTVYAYVW